MLFMQEHVRYSRELIPVKSIKRDVQDVVPTSWPNRNGVVVDVNIWARKDARCRHFIVRLGSVIIHNQLKNNKRNLKPFKILLGLIIYFRFVVVNKMHLSRLVLNRGIVGKRFWNGLRKFVRQSLWTLDRVERFVILIPQYEIPLYPWNHQKQARPLGKRLLCFLFCLHRDRKLCPGNIRVRVGRKCSWWGVWNQRPSTRSKLLHYLHGFAHSWMEPSHQKLESCELWCCELGQSLRPRERWHQTGYEYVSRQWSLTFYKIPIP